MPERIQIMLIINHRDLLNTPVPSAIRKVLNLRTDLIDLATFIVVLPGDDITSIETATGFPLLADHPPWEWVLKHEGAFEAPIITNDDGSGVVLIVSDSAGVDASLLAILRQQAERPESCKDRSTG